jgi:hypothetical protein
MPACWKTWSAGTPANGTISNPFWSEIKIAYLADIFNVSYLEVTVTSNDILRIEIKRSSTSVRVGFAYKVLEWKSINSNAYRLKLLVKKFNKKSPQYLSPHTYFVKNRRNILQK